MALIITKAGLEKAIDASSQGISFNITHVGVGDMGYVPDVEQDSLKNEIKRIAISGGKRISSNQIHLTALFDGGDEIIGREMGFYLEDGTLFAIDSDPDIIIMYKSGSNGSRALEAFDLTLDSVPADSITVDVTGDLTLNFDKDFEEIKQFTIDELSKYTPTLKAQYAPWDATRTYKTGEVCTIEVDGEVIAMQMYAGPNMTCINKNPADLTNRHEQWEDPTKPFWWIPYTGNIAGQMSGWLSDSIPESAVLENEVDLPAVMYWRLAKAWPELVITHDEGVKMINTRDILGRYVRTADGVDYLLNTTHEDAIRNITGTFSTKYNIYEHGCTGAFAEQRGDIELNIATNGSARVGGDFSFDSSRIVPTASQNQPVTTIENKIIFI